MYGRALRLRSSSRIGLSGAGMGVEQVLWVVVTDTVTVGIGGGEVRFSSD